MTWKQKLFTVAVFTKLSTRRFFRDSLALFFGIAFPLIFLFVFGSLSSGNNISFKVALINDAHNQFSQTFTDNLKKGDVIKVDQDASASLSAAKDKMSKSQIDGIIVLPKDFGVVKNGQPYPSGKAQVIFNKTSSGTGNTLTSVLQEEFKQINAKYVSTPQPFAVQAKEINAKNLTSFDYTFAGLLGFSIIGMGIFGPVNVFPELKKQGILRRLRTTPIKTWQYFMATMFSSSITGIVAIAAQFVVAITVFDLKVAGNYIEIFLFTIFSIFMILGLGLAIGGWAKNERQAAPLSNIIVFPMLFLSGTFFPRFGMPIWLQHATNYLPLTPVIDGLRLLITEGKHLTDLGPQLGIMTVWFIVIYAIAFRVFRWE
jgi:ABC-2 type transport system permease protein